jgi:hypothetical protein
MKTEELIAKQEIHDVLMRYCRAVDRLDEELLRSVYFPDAWDDHGLFSGTRDDLIAWVIPFLRDNFTTSIHAIHNLLIEVNGDAAFSEAYFTGYYYTQHNGALHTRISAAAILTDSNGGTANGGLPNGPLSMIGAGLIRWNKVSRRRYPAAAAMTIRSTGYGKNIYMASR